jgi:hypothetical protein
MGEVVKEGHMINLFNCYAHPLYNPAIDLKTNMPVIVLPMKHPKTRETMGGIEVVNVKGIATMFQQLQPKITTIDSEVLE